ncbi:MAG: UDP-N-acetylmuramoyl-tripeptide--D-alanyl-D-alanine ligase [Pseudomonadales bacterium]|nr:UDP-N-acetylmuramoyl-tripeptide--D-alanyl-D-alanine ligase [Pseudomonadales bacterium]
MMSGIDLQMLAAANDGVLTGENAMVTGVCIDSRKVVNGDIFVALTGSQSDGHEYVASAAKRGAVAAIVEKIQDIPLPQIVVANALYALGVIAKVNRDAYQGKVVAITGSSGKTSCKNMLAAILEQVGKVCATHGNFNNEIGLPLTVQRLNENHDYAVLEMGAAKSGDISYLVGIGQPHISAITNINEAHIGGFGSIETTAKTKAEIYKDLPAEGWAVINRDDVFAHEWRESLSPQAAQGRLIECALTDSYANVYASDIAQEIDGLSFNVNIRLVNTTSVLPIKMNFLGIHNVRNALMAVAMAKALNVSDADIIQGLAAVAVEKGRLCRVAGSNNLQILDDSYNANPQSMYAAIDVLVSFTDQEKKSIAVLGDMAELGSDAAAMHFNVGQYAALAGVNCVYVIGEFAAQTLAGFNQQPDDEILSSSLLAQSFDSQDELIKQLLSSECESSVVLVKGSRSAAMDCVVSALSINTDASNLARTGEK